jgi:hypothetical protein
MSVIRQLEVHTAESLVPGPSRLEVEISIARVRFRVSVYFRLKMVTRPKHVAVTE